MRLSALFALGAPLAPLVLGGCDLFGPDPGDTWDDWNPETDADADADADGDADADADADGDADADADAPDPVVTWDASGLDLTLTGGSGSYDFGMAETGAGAGGWYGEDCLDGDGGYVICHSAAATGVRLNRVSEKFEVVSGQTTLLDENQAPKITYYLGDDAGNCWVWGDDITYYQDEDCGEIAR